MPLSAEPPQGLTSAQAAARMAAQGPNEMPAAHAQGRWRLLAEVVTEPMFVLLAAVVTAAKILE